VLCLSHIRPIRYRPNRSLSTDTLDLLTPRSFLFSFFWGLFSGGLNVDGREGAVAGVCLVWWESGRLHCTMLVRSMGQNKFPVANLRNESMLSALRGIQCWAELDGVHAGI
jgi:hypothetical protein